MIAVAALCDWLKTLVTVFKPKGGKTTHHFSRVLRKSQVNARNSDWFIRAVFKCLSKVITWLRLLRLVIGFKESRQFFNQWEAKPKTNRTMYAWFFPRFARVKGDCYRNCDWFIALFVPVVIGRSNCFGFGFSIVIWKPLYAVCSCCDWSN